MVERGDRDAEAKLRELPPEALQNPGTKEYVAGLWSSLGMARWKTAGPAHAIPALRTSLALAPSNQSANLTLLQAYWELNDPGLTLPYLESMAALVPDHPLPHLALARLLYNRDEWTQATAHLELTRLRLHRDPALEPVYQAMQAKLLRTGKRRVPDRAHFTLTVDGPRDPEAETRVVELLEEAYRTVAPHFAVVMEEPYPVTLHTRTRFEPRTADPVWIDSLYDPAQHRLHVPSLGVLLDEDWTRLVLRHQLAHAVLHRRVGRQIGQVPIWLAEGLAMTLSGLPAPAAGAGTGAAFHVTWKDLSGDTLAAAYSEAATATHFFIDRYGMDRLRDVLARLAKGDTLQEAWQDANAAPYSSFLREWSGFRSEAAAGASGLNVAHRR